MTAAEVAALRNLASATGFDKTPGSDDSDKNDESDDANESKEDTDESDAGGRVSSGKKSKQARRKRRTSSPPGTPIRSKSSKKSKNNAPPSPKKLKESFVIPKKQKPTSEKIPKNLWPSGVAKGTIDTMTFEQVMELRKLEEDVKKRSKAELPGMTLAADQDEVPSIDFEAMTDDGISNLHAARFLRMPQGVMKTWWREYMPAERTEKICNIDLIRFGSKCSISYYTIKARHNRRTVGFQVKHFMYTNARAENNALKTIMKQAGDGFVCDSVTDFTDAETVKETTMAILNYQSVDSVLWPLDYTANNLLRIGAHFGWWGQYNLDPKVAASIYKDLFREVLRKNAENWKDPPMWFDDMVKEAEGIMEAHDCPVIKPNVFKHLKNHMGKTLKIPQPGQQGSGKKERRDRDDVGDRSRQVQVEGGIDPKLATFNGVRICIPFNKKTTCPRTLNGNICEDSNRKMRFIHVCNKTMRDKAICGRNHPSVDH